VQCYNGLEYNSLGHKYIMMNKFEMLGVCAPAVKAVTELAFESPTPIQEKVIPALLEKGCDMVALAQTGTGKTAGFGLPLITMIDFHSKNTQALILAPTRELCMQITSDLKNFSKYIPGCNVVAVYGGASIINQINDLKRGAQIIVATPGRMVDIIDRKKVNLSTIAYVVLDEADEMLNMGFQEDLDSILSATPQEKNTWLFSATMPNEVSRISKKYMDNPIEITIGVRNQVNENIEHVYYVVNDRERYPALKRIVDFHPDIFGLIFCRTKIETQKVADMLIKDGYNADALHGDLSQAQRDYVMKRFRSKILQMLVATDVAARGIDVNDITHVINYNLPDEIENYTHRSGRTARAGKTGISITLVGNRDSNKIHTLERLTKRKFTRATIPGGHEICEKQLLHLAHSIHNAQVNEVDIEKFLPKIYDELKDLSKEEIIKRFVSTEFNRFLNYYKNAPDLNKGGMGGREGDRESGGHSREGVVKLFASIGELDGLDRISLKAYVSKEVEIPEDAITWVDVKKSFSFIEVKTEVLDKVMEGFKGKSYAGRPIRIESRGNSSEGIPRERFRGRGDREGRGGDRGERRGGERKQFGGGERRQYGGGGERRGGGGGDFHGKKKPFRKKRF
jgi:ATP-dependent RNA helicase DeaD